MAIYDRYLTVLFMRVLIVLFSALCGLFMIVDFFDRLEEFLTISKVEGSLSKVVFEFYAPRLLSFFDRISGLVALISAVFVVTWIQRNRELIAIFAAGVKLRRVVRPILICVVTVSLFGIVNREVLIPSYKHRLTRDTRNWFGEEEIAIRPTYDRQTGVFLNGTGALLAQNELKSPDMHLPPGSRGDFDRILAKSATYHSADQNHPPGFLLTDVSLPAAVNESHPICLRDETIVFTPKESKWLEPNTCFLVSNISVQDLTRNDANAVYSSTWELTHDFRNPSTRYNSGSRVMVHARILQPILDISLFLIGLSLVVSGRERNIFLSLGPNIILVVFYFLIQMGCHSLGVQGIVSPSQAAWMPILLFAPLAWVAFKKLD